MAEPEVTQPAVGAIRPAPSDEEAAAIVAAIEATWPRVIAGEDDPEMPRWRFSGRWWTKPLPSRRDRP
jgi:hypothetical protein